MSLKTSTWRRDLHEYIESVKTREFQPGEFDCFTFSLDCIEAVTGENVDSDFIGHYSTQSEADEILEENGGYLGVAEDLYEKKLGLEPKDINFLKKGEPVVLDESSRNLGFGINLTGGVGVPSLDRGIEKVKRDNIVKGWSL